MRAAYFTYPAPHTNAVLGTVPAPQPSTPTPDHADLHRGQLGLVGIKARAPGNNRASGMWSPVSQWLCAEGLAEAAFLMVGYKQPIFTFAYIMYKIPSLPSSLSAVLCIDLSFTLQPHFALLHFNDI